MAVGRGASLQTYEPLSLESSCHPQMGSFPASQVVAARMTPLTSVEMWLLGGDLSYSAGYFGAQANQVCSLSVPCTLTSPKALNDAFWRMIEPYAANIPVMVTSGNHESTSDRPPYVALPLTLRTAGYDNHYAAYLGRAGNSMPVDSPGMLYYSYDYRNVHFVALDSEGLDVQSSAQAQIDWINADLTVRILWQHLFQAPTLRRLMCHSGRDCSPCRRRH